MDKVRRVCTFLHDERAVSEEFTSLPALSVVMIGFTLFIVLLAHTYTAYEARVATLQYYQTADSIASKLTAPNCYFIREGGLVDLSKLRADNDSLNDLRSQYQRSGVNFLVRLHWNENTQDFPEELQNDTGTRIAVSKEAGVYLNEAQTTPGTLTIILWRISQ